MQQTAKEKKYVAINIGSSYITGILAIKHTGGHIQPLAMNRQLSRNNIKRGYIHNIDGTTQIIGLIIDELSKHLGDNEKISSVYVGLECISMRSRTFHSRLTLPAGDQIVTQEHLQTLRDQAQDASYPNHEVICILHPRYYVDGKPESKPQGVRSKIIEAVYQVITVRQNILDNLRTTFEDRLGLNIHEILVTPIAEASVCLSGQEAMLGCTYINIGGGVTSVSLYKDRLLSGLYILPMGGRDVTHDLESLALMENYAEQIKCSKASMNLDISRQETISVEGTSPISLLEINRVATARMAEILYNILNIAKEASSLISGDREFQVSSFVFGGGGIKFAGFMDEIEIMLRKSVIVRTARIRGEFTSAAVSEEELNTYSSEIALIHNSSKDCVDLLYQDMTVLTTNEEDDEQQEIEEYISSEPDLAPIGSDIDSDEPLELTEGIDNDDDEGEEKSDEDSEDVNNKSNTAAWGITKIFGRISKGVSNLVQTINRVEEEDD